MLASAGMTWDEHDGGGLANAEMPAYAGMTVGVGMTWGDASLRGGIADEAILSDSVVRKIASASPRNDAASILEFPSLRAGGRVRNPRGFPISSFVRLHSSPRINRGNSGERGRERVASP